MAVRFASDKSVVITAVGEQRGGIIAGHLGSPLPLLIVNRDEWSIPGVTQAIQEGREFAPKYHVERFQDLFEGSFDAAKPTKAIDELKELLELGYGKKNPLLRPMLQEIDALKVSIGTVGGVQDSEVQVQANRIIERHVPTIVDGLIDSFEKDLDKSMKRFAPSVGLKGYFVTVDYAKEFAGDRQEREAFAQKFLSKLPEEYVAGLAQKDVCVVVADNLGKAFPNSDLKLHTRGVSIANLNMIGIQSGVNGNGCTEREETVHNLDFGSRPRFSGRPEWKGAVDELFGVGKESHEISSENIAALRLLREANEYNGKMFALGYGQKELDPATCLPRGGIKKLDEMIYPEVLADVQTMIAVTHEREMLKHLVDHDVLKYMDKGGRIYSLEDIRRIGAEASVSMGIRDVSMETLEALGPSGKAKLLDTYREQVPEDRQLALAQAAVDKARDTLGPVYTLFKGFIEHEVTRQANMPVRPMEEILLPKLLKMELQQVEKLQYDEAEPAPQKANGAAHRQQVAERQSQTEVTTVKR